jgi:hypothetical protein
MNRYPLLAPVVAFLLAACATSQETEQPKPWPVPDSHCASATVLLDAHFEAGNLGRCTVSEDGSFTLALVSEDAPPINASAWYAFRASGEAGQRVDIRLELDNGYVRYWPRISQDGENWIALADGQVSGVGRGSKTATFSFELEGPQAWIAGQEIIDTADYAPWFEQFEGAQTRLLGHSVEGRPLLIAETPDRPEFVLLIGRQHPPEVTGALGMQAFLDTVFADTPLAARFRDRFKLGVIPLLNPDGVARGHWRHNVGDTDLNRDWGPFTQPETRAVMRWVEGLESAGHELVLVLDFHSTFEDLFYTQPVSEDPPDFASRWLGASRQRLPGFPFKHVPSTNLTQPNSKNYFHNSRGIPAITYEVGDRTDREAIARAANVFAEELMRLMLTP